MDEGFSLSPEMAAAAVFYGAALAAVGACATRFLVAPRLPPDDRTHLERSAATVGLAAAVLVCVALVLRAWTHTIVAFGFSEALVWDNVRVIAFESRWGQGWVRQAAAALGMLATFAAVRGSVTGGWTLATLSVALMTIALPLIGHAAGSPARMAIHAAHVTGAGLWLGTLTVLRFHASRSRASDRGLLAFRAFSGVAITGVSLLLLSGLLASSIYVGEPSHLVFSAYGRTLLVKVALVLTAATCGYFNWRDLHRLSARHPVSVTTRVTQELTFGILVVIVTGTLANLPHP